MMAKEIKIEKKTFIVEVEAYGSMTPKEVEQILSDALWAMGISGMRILKTKEVK